MKIKSLSYILIESTNLESWEAYARDVVGLMKNNDLSDENNLFFRMDESPFRFQIQKGENDRYARGGFELENKEAFEEAKKELSNLGIEVAPESVIAGDMEAIREFLVRENNAKKLNLAATTLIGVGQGAVLAAWYAIYDFDATQRLHLAIRSGLTEIGRTTPQGKKQEMKNLRKGEKDIKALVLISPTNKIGKQMKIDALTRHPEVGTGNVSTLILVGQKSVDGKSKKPRESKEFKAAKNLYEKLKRNDHITESDDVGKWTLFFNVIDTELNGEKLVNETNLDLKAREYVRSFLNLRVRDQDIPWAEAN